MLSLHDALPIYGRPVKLLCLQEIGENIVISPAGAAHRGPTVIIRPLAEHIDLSVDRRTAAEGFARGPLHRAAVDRRVGFGRQAPVELLVAHQERKSTRMNCSN